MILSHKNRSAFTEMLIDVLKKGQHLDDRDYVRAVKLSNEVADAHRATLLADANLLKFINGEA